MCTFPCVQFHTLRRNHFRPKRFGYLYTQPSLYNCQQDSHFDRNCLEFRRSMFTETFTKTFMGVLLKALSLGFKSALDELLIS